MVSPAALRTSSAGGSAQANDAHLAAAFPASPMLGADPTYGEGVVDLLRYRLVTNTIGLDPASADAEASISESQGYWGFSTPGETDLDYSTDPAPIAPDLDGVDAEDSTDGNTVASNLGPNLLPPDIINPSANVDSIVLPVLNSAPPFVGNGKANPRATSITNKAELVETQLLGNTPLPLGGNPSDAADGNVGEEAD